MSDRSQRAPSTSILVFIISMIVMFIIASYFIYSGYTSFLEGRSDAYYQMLIGIISMASIVYVVVQYRARSTKYKVKELKVFSKLEHEDCGYSAVRNFIKGDYVFKTVEKCPKCDSPMTITRIYPEKKDEKKSSSPLQWLSP